MFSWYSTGFSYCVTINGRGRLVIRLVACIPVPLGDPIYSVTGRKVCAGPNRAVVVFLVLK